MKTTKSLMGYALFFISTFCFSQVGINTDTPRAGAALDVNGSMKSGSVLLPENLPAVSIAERETFVYLVQNQATGAVEHLDLVANGNSGGISSILTYQLANVDGDWVLDFDTKISAEDYALVILSAWFDRNLVGPKPAPPMARATSIGNTWHLEADYSSVSSNTNGTWYITCVVYPKSYAKIFPVQTVSMGGSTTAVASTPIVSY